MDFMRYVSVEVPTVYSWSKDSNNPIGSPYILMEDPQGVPLQEEWYDIQGSAVLNALLPFAMCMTVMSSISFSRIGALHFKEDVPSHLQKRPLFRDDPNGVADELQWAADRFCKGPIVDQLWWRDVHDDLDADRGPCKSCFPFLLIFISLADFSLH